jgi:hypothetical protein
MNTCIDISSDEKTFIFGNDQGLVYLFDLVSRKNLKEI